MDERLKFQIALSLIPGIGSINAKKLIAYTGGVEAIFREKKQNLQKIPGIGVVLANTIKQADVMKTAEEEIAFIEKLGIKVFFFLDKDYPERLKNCDDAPIIIYFKGHADLNAPKVLSIVGTRRASRYGKEQCVALIESLSTNGHNPLIISGLAYGIDVCSHQVALKNNLNTIGILGHGLQMIYPAAHRNIAKEMIEQGGLLTEFTGKSKLDPANFVRRNRIIAGLSDATIVVESAKKGGSLITAEIANSYNRDVFAFPGRVNDKYSEGCNKLIKSNKAALIEGVSDLEYILGWDKIKKVGAIQKKMFVELNPDEKQIIDILSTEDMSVDIICQRANLPMSKVSSLLLQLEFSGLIKSLPGKIYKLT